MAMPSTASCCLSSSSSPHGRPRLTHTATAWSPARIRLVSRSAPSRNPLRLSFSSAEPAPDVAGDEGEYMDKEVEEDRDERYGFEMEVRKLPGKKNRRLVRARVRVGAPLQAVWATLTDYEGLAGFIPGLSECRLLHQDKAFARLYQVGEQDLALGFKFNAKGTIDCYEGEMELLPESRTRRREIAFNMVDGDFKVFEGKWSVHEVDGATDEGTEISPEQEFQTTLSYVVELEPKLWVPVRLLEGRICKEIKTNLICIREEAERIQRLLDEVREQDLTLGLKFNSKGTIGCYKGERELLPESGVARWEIAFNMVDGDFKFFGGKWSVQEVADTTEGGEISSGQEFQTTLSYVVELEPKLWVPVRLPEGRICKEIKTNLVCIREEAERVQRLHGSEVTDTNQAV